MSKQKRLFKTKIVPAKDVSGKLWDEEFVVDNRPVTCLGLEFENDEARRAHFTELLRERLRDPEFRKIEGFPIGEDEDILKLSDPPYYTACPNPWIGDFIAQWEKEKNPPITQMDADENNKKEIGENQRNLRINNSADNSYHREPFAADVSEGKNDPIYNAHSYHTKVPHKAIMRYILHYTEPGDIVFDGFAGTGMTGVAAQMCGDKAVVESLGVTKDSPTQKYKVENDGTIYQKETEPRMNTNEHQLKENDSCELVSISGSKWVKFSKLGARKAVLNDLSPAATFIAYNYNTPVDVAAFEQEAKRILAEVEEECGWMYQTIHHPPIAQMNTDDINKIINNLRESAKSADKYIFGKINYTVWSDVFVCPECANEVIFWDVAVDKEAGKVKDKFPCPHCNAELTKRKMERAWTTKFDKYISEPGTKNQKLGTPIRQAKQVPVLINYSVPGSKGRFEKRPDEFDLALIEKIENSDIPYWFPTDRMMEGKETRRNDPAGITHVHHFYTKRNLWVLAALWKKLNNIKQGRLALTSILIKTAGKLHNIGLKNGKINLAGALPNTLYVPANIAERNIFELISGKIDDLVRAKIGSKIPALVTSSSLGNFPLTNNNRKFDYIFIDPPFGSNLNYSELNFLWESWLKVFTNNKPEVIENSVQGKGPAEYRQLMTACFKEAYRVLKPGRWMTVEFSNTKASVWNSIQTALTEAGFLVANVAALDKGQGTFHSQTNPTSVKQDLIISAYKPNGGFEERFRNEAQTEEGVWDFVRTHMKYLPVTKKHGADFIVIPERDPRILYDQVIAYYVRKGYNVPIDSQDFQLGLSQRFSERDGMYFLPEQVAEYDRKKMIGGGRAVQQSLFVFDESSAIEWLRNLLRDKPQSFQDINPKFMQEISGWNKHEKGLELFTLLEQNFLRYDGSGKVPEQIHGYLSHSWRDMRNLQKDDPALIAKAKDRWYVPDPNKAGDLEKLREKALLKEFEEYKQSTKKLKIFRLEAVRAGFKKAWQERDYKVIIIVAEKIPSKILEEDPKLLMWYDQAVTRMGGK